MKFCCALLLLDACVLNVRLDQPTALQSTGGDAPDGSTSGATSAGTATGGASSSGATTGGASSGGATSGTSTVVGLHAVMGTGGRAGSIVDKNGNIVVLHGVDESGSENFCLTWGPPPIVFSANGEPSPVTQESLTAMKQWGINTVRIPMNEDCWLGINGVDASVGGVNYQNAIADAVDRITKTNSMYVILDLHHAAPGSTKALVQGLMPDADHTVTFWQQVATAYKDNGSVIFDLLNEPNTGGDGAADYQCWRDGGTACNINHYPAGSLATCSLTTIAGCASGCSGCTPTATASFTVVGMQALLNAVRATGATNLVMLGGIGDAWNLAFWASYVPTDTLSPPNLAASWHFYDCNIGGNTGAAATAYYCDPTLDSQNNLDPKSQSSVGLSGVIAAGYPIVVGETGYHCNGSAGATWWPTFLSWMDTQGIGFVAWAWSDGSTPQLLTETTNFTPNANGQVYQKYLSCIAGKTVTPASSCTALPNTGCE